MSTAGSPMATSEESLAATVTAVHAEAARIAADARAALDRAQADVEACEAAAATAAAAHVDAPEDKKLATAALAADSALSLSRKRLSAAQEKASRAGEALAGAERALAAAKRDVRRAELRTLCAPQTLAAALDAPTKQLLSAFDAFRTAADAIHKAHAGAVSASAELRSLGEHVADLHPLHALAPAYLALASTGTTPGGMANPHLDLMAVPPENAISVFTALSSMRRPPSQALWAPEALRARLVRFQTCRNFYEFEDRERADAKAAAPIAVYPPLPPPPSANGRISHAPSREDDGGPATSK